MRWNSVRVRLASAFRRANGSLPDTRIAGHARHAHDDLPVLIVGRGGNLRLGQHIVYPKGTPMTNLFMTLLDRMGVQPERIGDSTGRVEHLTAV